MSELIKSKSPMPEELIAHIGKQLGTRPSMATLFCRPCPDLRVFVPLFSLSAVSALAYLHAHDFVHRDLKPQVSFILLPNVFCE